MKHLLLLFSFIFPASLLSQESTSDNLQELANKIAPGFCGCLEKYDFLEATQEFGNCFAVNLAAFEDELSQFYPVGESAGGEAESDKLVYDLLTGMQVKLFDDCEAYYRMVKTIKENSMRQMQDLEGKQTLESLEAVPVAQRDANFYFRRGALLFADKQFKEAEVSLKEGLQKNPENIHFKLLLAWLYEDQGDEAGALKIIDEVIAQTGGIEFVMFKELTRRNFRVVEKKKPECNRFQTGEFRILDPETGNFTSIRRTEDLQIETSSRDNSTTKLSVVWLDDCNYVLTYLESTSPEMEDYIGKELRVEILETNGDTYKFKATMEGVDHIVFDEIQKVG